MGVFDFLFGTKPEAVPIQQPRLTGEQQAGLKGLLGAGGPLDVAGISQLDRRQFGGELAVGPSTLEQRSLAGLEAAASGVQPGGAGGATAGVGGDLLQNFLQNLTPGEIGPDFEEEFQTLIGKPAQADFGRAIDRATRSFGGQFSGSDVLDRVTREAGEFTTRLASKRAELAEQRRSSSITDFLKGVDLTTGVSGAQTAAARGPIDILTQLLGAGQVPSGREERNVERQLGEFQGQEDVQGTRINQLIAALGGIQPFDNTIVAQPGSAGLLSNVLTAAAGGIGAGVGRRIG